MTPVARTRRGEGAILRHSPQKPERTGPPHPGRATAQFWRAQAGPGIDQPLEGRILHARSGPRTDHSHADSLCGWSWLSPSTKRTRGTLVDRVERVNLEVEPRGKLGVLRADLNLAEALTELKRSASPVAHIDQQVKDAKKLLPQLERHGRLAVRKVLDQTGNARGDGRAVPALEEDCLRRSRAEHDQRTVPLGRFPSPARRG